MAQTLTIKPAYDCILIRPCTFGSDDCRPGAGGSHGRGSASMVFVVSHETPVADYTSNLAALRRYSHQIAAVQFFVHTGWSLDETEEALGDGVMRKPIAADLGWHSPYPLYEDQEPRPDCLLVGRGRPGKDCYYDGSALQADLPWRILREHGSDKLWQFLEGEYRGMFGEAWTSLSERASGGRPTAENLGQWRGAAWRYGES